MERRHNKRRSEEHCMMPVRKQKMGRECWPERTHVRGKGILKINIKQRRLCSEKRVQELEFQSVCNAVTLLYSAKLKRN